MDSHSDGGSHPLPSQSVRFSHAEREEDEASESLTVGFRRAGACVLFAMHMTVVVVVVVIAIWTG